MSIHIKEHSPYSVIIEKEGKKYIGFLSISNKKTDMSGWIVNEKTLQPWEAKGIVEFEKKKYVYGPFFDGKFLENEMEDLQLTDIHRLSDALLRLPESFSINKLHTYGIMKNSSEFLILPQFTIDNYLKLTTTEQRFKHYDRYNSPDRLLKPFSFSFAILAYKSVTKCMPYPADNSSEYFHKLGDKKIIAPNVHNPELKTEISDAVFHDIKGKKPGTDVTNWKFQLAKWNKDGIYRDISDEEKSNILKQKVKQSTAFDIRHKRLSYIRNNQPKLIALSSIVIVFFIIGGILLSNMLKPPFTENMTQEEVVHSFYEGYNTLNHIMMSGCVVNGAGKEEIKRTISFNVVSQVQKGYENSSRFISARNYLNQGMTASQFGFIIWGVADLNITQLDDLRFTAEYKYWEIEESVVNGSLKAVYNGYTEKAAIMLEKRIFKYGHGDPEYYVISSLEIKDSNAL